MIRILLAIPNEIVREGITRIVEHCPDCTVAATANRLSEIVGSIKDGRCDVLILFAAAPQANTVDVVKHLKQHHSHVPVIILSATADSNYGTRIVRAGADGYLTLAHGAQEVIESIHKAARGSKRIATAVVQELIRKSDGSEPLPPHELLSNREYQVFLMLVEGKGLNEIANTMNLSNKTVSTYRTRILEKFKMESNAGLVRYAIQNDLLED